jgi:hypothetical protein
MLIKFLGITDIIIAILFTINANLDRADWFPEKIIFWAGIFLLVKGILFVLTLDIASVLDILCAVVMLLSLIFNMPLIISAIVIIILLQKGLFSLVN